MVNWDVNEKFRLMLAIMEVAEIASPNWNAVAEKLGEGYTKEAIRQQFKKIKVAAASELASPAGDADAGGDADKTPKKAAATKTPKTPKTKTPAKRTKAAATEDGEDDNDEDKASPVKKARKTPAKKRAPAKSKKVLSDENIKSEDGDDQDDKGGAEEEVPSDLIGEDEV